MTEPDLHARLAALGTQLSAAEARLLIPLAPGQSVMLRWNGSLLQTVPTPQTLPRDYPGGQVRFFTVVTVM